MRYPIFMLFLIGCVAPDSTHGGAIDAKPLGAGPAPDHVIPYRASGAFAVRIAVDGTQFESSTRATAEILTSELTMATTSATITLDDDGSGSLVGTAALNWPPGGLIDLEVEAAGLRRVVPVNVELPTLARASTATSNNGSQTVVEVCLDSSVADGTVTLRVDGATFKDTTNVEATLPLTFGTCGGTPTTESSSHVRFKLAANDASIAILATMPNTGVSLAELVSVQAFAAVDLTVTPPAATPPPFSIVELGIHAERDNADAKGIVVTLSSSPTLAFLSATVTTDANGDATAYFQMPESGGVVIQARAGNEVETVAIPAL